MIARKLTIKLQQLATQFPVVAILGPRQSGKTTLAQNTFADYTYLSLENYKTKTFAQEDPDSFLETYKNHTGLILDEIQEAPHLLSCIQTLVDQSQKPGFFVITGSQNFLLNETITQTLAGRVAICTLLPLSCEELATAHLLPDSIESVVFKGLYPRIHAQNVPTVDWYLSYIKTYIERDVRQIKNITDLATFQHFIGLCAGRIGQLLNITSLANDCGISVATTKSWLSLLEASYLIFLLQPHHQNFSKRLIKSPKLYFYDTGVACYVLGIETESQLANHYLRGGLVESLIISELHKQRFNQGRQPRIYFWRDKTGHEIDCIIEKATELIPIEIKAGKTVSSNFFDNLLYWNTLSGTPPEKNYVVYAGNESQKRSQAKVISWKKMDEIF